MKTVFVDTFFYIDAMSQNAVRRQAAEKAVALLGQARFVTTQLVLAELLNFYAEYKPFVRMAAASLVRNLLTDPETEVIELQTASFSMAWLFTNRARTKATV